jgi:hypothetical protein
LGVRAEGDAVSLIGPSRRIHYLAHVRSWWKQTRGMEGVRRF